MNERTSAQEDDFLRSFGRHLAHQFNNPISAIKSSAYLIKDFLEIGSTEPARPEQILPFVESIREECDSLKRMVDEIQRYASLDQPLLSEVEFREFLTARSRELSASTLPTRFDDRTRSETVTLLFDMGLLTQALGILAREAARQGAKQLTIALDSDEQGFCIIISDDRSPVPSAEAASSYFSFSRQRGTPGLGLDLPYVSRVVALHGGAITAQTSGGEFATVIKIRRNP